MFVPVSNLASLPAKGAKVFHTGVMLEVLDVGKTYMVTMDKCGLVRAYPISDLYVEVYPKFKVGDFVQFVASGGVIVHGTVKAWFPQGPNYTVGFEINGVELEGPFHEDNLSPGSRSPCNEIVGGPGSAPAPAPLCMDKKVRLKRPMFVREHSRECSRDGAVRETVTCIVERRGAPTEVVVVVDLQDLEQAPDFAVGDKVRFNNQASVVKSVSPHAPYTYEVTYKCRTGGKDFEVTQGPVPEEALKCQ